MTPFYEKYDTDVNPENLANLRFLIANCARDVTMTAHTMRALFQYGVTGWLDAMLDQATGTVVKSDLQQLAIESDRIFLDGSMDGDWKFAPLELVPDDGLVRDGSLATIGSGNHFVEVQRVERVENRALAHAWGVREGQLAFMIHYQWCLSHTSLPSSSPQAHQDIS